MKGKYNLEDVVVDGRMILNLILKKYDAEECTGFNWVRTGTNGVV
jgi:hypothetical protein